MDASWGPARAVKQLLISQNAGHSDTAKQPVRNASAEQPVRNESKTVSYSGVIGGVLARLAYECALEVLSVALDTSKVVLFSENAVEAVVGTRK